MGADGHTASLFPHSPAPAEKDALVAAVNAPAGIQPADRVTLTLQALALSERILFMIAGDEKRKLLDTIMSLPERAAQRYPAAAVRARSELYWMVSTR
jgi:6-phosphogluconolactonase